MNKKVLVTGAGGYIGSVASYLLLQKDYEVVALDNYSTGFRQPLEIIQQKFGKDKIKVYEADLQKDFSDVLKNEPEISAVFHYAASSLVDESMKNPQKYFTNNVVGTQNLLTRLLEAGIKKIVFSSTCAVYGDTQYSPVDEKHPTNPNNPYGESKRMVEKIMDWYGKQSGLQFVVLRYFNVCGATDDGLLGYSKRPFTHLVETAVRGALGIEPFSFTYQKFDTKDGSPIRDYVNVTDLNEAHLSALEYLEKGGKNDIFNVGTGTGNSVLEIVKKVQEITGKTFEAKQSQPRIGEYAQAVAAIDRAKEILGWEPKHSLEDSIKSTISWYKNHPNGWED